MLDAAGAAAAGMAHEVCAGVHATQRRALEVARLLSRNAGWAEALVHARVHVDDEHLAEEAVSHAECAKDNDGILRVQAAFANVHAAPSLVMKVTDFIAAHPRPERAEDVHVVHTVEVPVHLGRELTWPSNAILVFRGGADAEHFCLGGDPSQANLKSSSFLDNIPAFVLLRKRLEQAPRPALRLPCG